MAFDDLYKDAAALGYGKTGKEGRKAGRIQIIRWLCENHGIIPYTVRTIAGDASTVDALRVVLKSGATAHPEAILQTSDPELRIAILNTAKQYAPWSLKNLVEPAMSRSYQLLKDSQGKQPSKSRAAITNWLAAWDVLKCDREKKWWEGDGIDLVNRAKAMGYTGSSTKKYDVIHWLRNTPEEAELAVSAVVAGPTPVRGSSKYGVGGPVGTVSNRIAKGSTSPMDGIKIRDLDVSVV